MDIRAEKLKELVQEVKLYNNPEELEAVKKLIKKNVPLSMRGYLLAYLFVSSPAGKTKPTRTLPENSTSLYVNVGKASRSSAKELGEFIIQTSGINSSDITGIAYKQNYSFVYVNNGKAETVIEKVNGQTYKGRRVKVNYSKEKDEN